MWDPSSLAADEDPVVGPRRGGQIGGKEGVEETRKGEAEVQRRNFFDLLIFS